MYGGRASTSAKNATVRTDFVEIEANGQCFRLYFDRDQSGVLHIHSRHGMTAEDAVALFFEGERDWNEQRRRFESTRCTSRRCSTTARLQTWPSTSNWRPFATAGGGGARRGERLKCNLR